MKKVFHLYAVLVSTFFYTAKSKYTKVHEHGVATLSCSYGEHIEVDRATYSYHSDRGDFTDRVNRYCCAQSTCSVKVENDFLGGDPSVGHEKDLYVYYRCIKASPNLQNCKSHTCTRSSNVKCTKCNEKLLYKLYDGRCIDKCSWNNRLCWPGTCRNEYAKDCHCDKDFSLRSQSSETSCQPTKKPTLLTCRMTVNGDGGEMRYSPTTGSTECKNQQDFYGRFQIKSVTIHMESEYGINTTSKKPNYIESYTFGITEAIVSVQRRNVRDPTPRKITNETLKHDGSTRPVPLFKGDASLNVNEVLSDGDRVCVGFETKGGGFVVAHDIKVNSNRKYHYSRPSSNKEICYYYDVSAPMHCSQTLECDDEPLSVSERISDSRDIFVSTSNWKDPYPKGGSPKHASGISSLDITVNEMISTGHILSRGNNVLSVKMNTTKTLQLPESETPILYEVLLEVKDVADNVRKARRFVLYDNSSYIEINQNSSLRASSAAPQTKYLWQTNLKAVCFSWKGRYVNRYHVNGQFLHRIKSDEDITANYEQVNGLLPVNGTRNVNGITNYNFTLYRNDQVAKRGIVPNYTKEATCINHEIFDGDKLSFEVTAMDIVKHTETEKINVLVDSTVPEIGDIYLERNGEKRLFVHSEKDLSTMKLHFEAFDVHSGIHEIQWSLRASENNVLFGRGAISINRIQKNETCKPSSSCYCPKQGPCELSNHTIDFNLLVANNTHMGKHNRRYIFSLMLTNNALLRDIEHIDILIDESAPEKGVVREGPKGGPDVDYTEENSTIINWDGFIDHESGITKYVIAIGPDCLPQQNLVSKNISDRFHISETKHTEIRMPLKNSGKNYVTVIAFNNALEPSDAVCSDGITFDRSIPKIHSVNISLAKTNDNIACLNEEAWIITSSLKRIRLQSSSPTCVSICKGKQDTEYVSLLPVLDKTYEEDRAAFLCSYLPFNNDTLIYIPDDKINIEWSVQKRMSQVDKIYIGFGSQKLLLQNPDLLSYEKVEHPAKYTKHHIGFSNGELFYLFLKVISKTGVFSTSVIGPLLIDETPPICPRSLPVQMERDKVLMKWNSSTFKDMEQKEQMDSLLFSVVSEKGHKTPIHEWRLYDSRQLCISKEGECLAYPLFKLQALDSQAGLNFSFHIQVFNKAGHSCFFQSESFKLPSLFGPGLAKVIDVFSDDSSETASVDTDTDIVFGTSKFCIRYSGLRAHENITLSLGLGTAKLSDDVVPFKNIGYYKPRHLFCMENLHLEKQVQYFATVKASCTGGVSLSSSDGFYALDEGFLKDTVSVYNGPSCKTNKKTKPIPSQTDSKGILKLTENLLVGQLYTFVSPNNDTNLTSNNVLIQSKKKERVEFIPMTENPKFFIPSTNESLYLFDFYKCVQDVRFFTSPTDVSFSWDMSAFVRKLLSHLVIGVQKRRSNQTYDDFLQFNVKKTNFFRLGRRLESGEYRGYVVPCFGPVCRPKIFSKAFTIITKKPKVGNTECNVTFTIANNIAVSGQFDSFDCSTPNDEILFYHFGLSEDEMGKISLEEKHIIRASNTKRLQFHYPFKGRLSPLKKMYFCTEGFCRSSLSSTSCVRVYNNVQYNLFDKTYVFEYDKRRNRDSTNALSILQSSDFSEKLAFMESLDVDFVRSDRPITGIVLPGFQGKKSWFLMKERRIPSTGCTEDISCIQSKSTLGPEISFSLKTRYTRILYLCVKAKVFSDIVKSTSDPQNIGICSDGFKIDNDKPVSGSVTISSDNGFVTATSEMYVVWEGFQDLDSSDDGYFRNHIANYKIAIGSQPGKQDVLPFTDAGTLTKFQVQDISLKTGLAYYATIKAYDMAGNTATAFSPGVVVDETPPTRGVIYVGGPSWHKKVIGGETLEVHWNGFQDYESGIAQFEIAVGTAPYSDDVIFHRKILGRTSAILPMNQPGMGDDYFVTLIATNMAGLMTAAHSDIFTFDNTPPRPGVVRDGSLKNNHDLDFQDDSTSISVHWMLFSDSESGISYYRVGLGLNPEIADVFSLHYVGNQTNWTWRGSFVQGCKYYALVEACNSAFLCTTVPSNGIIIDDSSPIPGLVRIGNLDHVTKYIPKRTSVRAKWIGFQDPQSGIRDFEVCVGSTTTTCDIMPPTNVLLSDSFIATGLNLPITKPLFFIVRANNHVGMTTVTSSDSFAVDDTSPILLETPRFTNCKDKTEIHYQIDVSRLCIEWNITDEESSIVSHTIQYRTHDDGHVPVEHSLSGSFQTFQLILSPTDWLLSGDTYTATITACNSADLCTSSESGQLIIDSTPPLVGGFMQPMSWSCTNMVRTINVTWFGFSDVESGINSYIISVGKTYSGKELKDAYQVYAKEAENYFQNTSITLEDTFNMDEKIVLSISAVNKAGLRSLTAKVSVVAKGSRDKLGSRGTLVIEKHSCDIHYCNNDCTCAVFGKKCKPEKHLPCRNESTSLGDSLEIFIHNIIHYKEKKIFLPGSCVETVWNDTDDALRYEWSIGIEGMQEGDGIFDSKIEPVWYDVGLDTNVTYCTRQKHPFQHGYHYTFYVRKWISQVAYAQYASEGILVDNTPPLVRKGKFIMESTETCSLDLEFSTDNTTLTACWRGVFSDQQSGIQNYFVLLGTNPEGDDVMKAENVGLSERRIWTGLSLDEGTKYFVTVTAVNNVGLTSSSYSDGVVIDFEKPVEGVVFNTISLRNIHAQADHKVIGSSWYGFIDRHSFLKDYLVTLLECDGQLNWTSVNYTNVGLETQHIFKGLSLKHNRKYCVAVKARDAAGFESKVSISTPLTIDRTPPSGIKCMDYENTNFDVFEKKIFDQGLELIGSLSFVKDEFVRFEIDILNSTDNEVIQISFLDKKLEFYPHLTYDNIISGEFEYLAEISTRTNASIFVSNINDASFIKPKISKCVRHYHIPYYTERSINLVQMSQNTVGIELNIKDSESDIRNVSLSLGTTFGGNQVYKMSAVGLMRFFTFTTDVPHRTPMYASVMVENVAGLRFYDYSYGTIMDHTGPDICCGGIGLSYEEKYNVTLTSVSLTWTAIDDESGVDYCTLTLGSVAGGVDIQQGHLISGRRSSFQTNYFFLGHGDKIHATIRCTNRVRMWTMHHIEPAVVSFEPPNVRKAQTILVGNRGQIDKIASELDTNLTIFWDGFEDPSVLTGYQCLFPGDPLGGWRNTGMRTSYTIPFDQTEEGNMIYTDIRAINVGGLASETYERVLNITSQRPRLSGFQCTVEKVSKAKYKVSWDKVFVKEMDLTYTANVGSAEGIADLIETMRSTDTHVILNIDDAEEIFIAVEAESDAGLNCNYRKVLKIVF